MHTARGLLLVDGEGGNVTRHLTEAGAGKGVVTARLMLLMVLVDIGDWRRWAVVIEVGPEDGEKSLGRRIMEVFGLLPDAVLALICKAALDAPLTWPLVT
jgi:hypothetical protein